MKTPQARQVPSALRVRKAPNNGASEEWAKKIASDTEATPTARAVKA
jgi:hypothetical protein